MGKLTTKDGDLIPPERARRPSLPRGRRGREAKSESFEAAEQRTYDERALEAYRAKLRAVEPDGSFTGTAKQRPTAHGPGLRDVREYRTTCGHTPPCPT